MKHKDFVIGVLTGAVLFGSFTAIANNYDIYPNPFKILVNGSEKYIEGYNINGYSYFKLRDIGNEMDFTVDFKEDTIMIDSGLKLTTSTNDDELWYSYVTINSVDYIVARNLGSLIQDNVSMDWQLGTPLDETTPWKDDNGYYCYLQNQEFPSFVTIAEYKIPCVFIDGKCYLTREVFENEVLARVLSDK